MLWAARVLARTFGTLWELLSRRRRRPAATDPAEELRHRLAEARARELETAPELVEPAPEPDRAPGEPPASSIELEDLRRDVHARARALSEEMRGTSGKD
jgi:hypothetical protein